MESAAEWALTVCICAVIACVAEVLASHTGLEKNVRMVLGLFMLSAVVVPLGHVIQDLRVEMPADSYELSDELPAQISDERSAYVRDALKKLILDRLREQDYQVSDAEVQMNIDDSGSITMITARLMIPTEESRRAPEICRFLESELGIDCKAVITDH